MEYFANFPAGHGVEPMAWARAREADGFHGICASDHFWVNDTRYPHVFVLATQFACATEKIKITTSFANNLFRSPVEFAQASLSLQQASNGRFEAGLGAGWLQDEIEAVGETYPIARDRVSRYIEALHIVRQLLHTGGCEFEGEFYQVHIPAGKLAYSEPDSGVTPPPLVSSAGGPRGIRESTPLVDRLEIKASARATRGGELDFAVIPTVTREEVQENVARARAINPDIPLGVFILTGAGNDPAVAALKTSFGNGYLNRFVGEAEEVVEGLQDLEALGIGRVQLTELVPGSHAALAPHLKLS